MLIRRQIQIFLSREKSGKCLIRSHSKNYIVALAACLPDGVCSSKHTQNYSTSTPAKFNPDIIEIISSEESENEGLEKTEQSASVSKKRTLPRTKEVIELSDSENELRSMKKMKIEDNALITMHIGAGLGPKPPSTPVTDTNLKDTSLHKSKVSEAEKRTITDKNLEIAIENAEKDKDGKIILTKKVKVDAIEPLSEVPKRWPIPPEGLNVAYVVDLNNDKRWKDSEKKKGLDRFLKQEVFVSYLIKLLINLICTGPRLMGSRHQWHN